MTDNMSGKIIPVGTKDDIKRFQSQKSTVEITSATISPPPPLPPARPGTKPMRQYLPPTGLLPFQCPKCGSSQGDCNHQYDEIGLSIKRTEEEFNQYEALLNTDVTSESNVDIRLRKIEDNQTRIRNEFNEFRVSIVKSIKSLEGTIKHLTEQSDSLDDTVRESFGYVHSTMDKMHLQLLASNDHLGKQILEVRRDIMAVKSPGTNTESRQHLQKCTHTFEWEVGNLENMLRSQQHASSQSYLVGQTDFKILGGATCTKEGLFCVNISGDFTHMPMSPWEKKDGSFQCTAFIVDKSGKMVDYLVGQITGDMNKNKTWKVGDVAAREIQTNGYTTRAGDINMKFVLEVYA